MNFRRFFTAAIIATAATTAVAQAADCTVNAADPFDLGEADVTELYACIEGKMAEGYAKEGHEIGTAFRSWTVTSTRPAVAGAHGNRLLQTFANDIAAEQYLKFEEEGVVMPVGAVLAKESIKITKKQTGRVGPLFTMTKLETGAAPDAGDWLYGGVQPNGKVMKVKQSFCHDCHSAWETQDMLAYPLEEVRISN
ncbi:cytochrome P460 family protein [Litoreibacter roseus]|uniref:Cytochrome P460 domain-containing protein n=1 Tax=Litoreibacter roseus TaxID=2601869 RepID=A0A6N6JH16_9RHOB|nr:cytochrome P460 family protein [Litoreibacter roseus]GFE65257.1 hypothetical protein KIN_23310 [Litoreibacter roseus]